jgi:hypothetical protein
MIIATTTTKPPMLIETAFMTVESSKPPLPVVSEDVVAFTSFLCVGVAEGASPNVGAIENGNVVGIAGTVVVVDGTEVGAEESRGGGALGIKVGIVVGISGVASVGPVGTMVTMDVGPMVSLLHA